MGFWTALVLSSALSTALRSQAVVEPRGRLFHRPVLAVAGRARAEPLLRTELKPLLDRNRSLATVRLGAAEWRLGIGFDPSFRRRFVLMSRDGQTIARTVREAERLRRGITIEPEPGLRYRLDLDVSLRDPLRRSVVKLDPERGVPGAPGRLTTDLLWERAREAARVFRADGREWWLFYLSDIDAGREAPADSRTLLFVRPGGLRSAAWPVSESALPSGQPMSVRLGDVSWILLRRPDGVLEIYPGI